MEICRFTCKIVIAAAMCTNVAARSEGQSNSKPPHSSLIGTWSVVTMHDNGNKVPPRTAETLRLVFSEEKLVMRIAENVIAETDYTADATHQLGKIDLTFEDQPTPGIFQLKGDNLIICLGRSVDKRPSEFISKANSPGRMLIVLKRGDLSPAGSHFFVMGTDGTGLSKLAELPRDMLTGSPDWSPSGDKIAFDCWRLAKGESGSQAHICVINVDGTQFQDLSAGAMPSWSPDGKRLVFCKYGQGLWVMNADGSDQKCLDDASWGCDWSPTANQIITTSRRTVNINVIDLDTEKSRSILKTEEYKSVYWNLCWSPDGKSICFKGIRPDGTQEIAVVSVQGDNHGFKVLLSTKEDQITAFDPIVAWGGNADQILVPVRVKGSKALQIYLLDPAGKEPPRRLPGQDAELDNGEMAWSPDGKQIVFNTRQPE